MDAHAANPDARSPRPPVRLACLAANGIALGVLGGLALHALGRVFTDRSQWSQYLWWVPAAVSGALAFVGLVLSHVFAFGARVLARRSRAPMLASGRWLRRGGWAGLVLLAGHALLVEWRPPGASDIIPRSERFRIAYWNFSVEGAKGWERPLTNADPDLFVCLAGTCTSGEGLIEWVGPGHDYFFDTAFVVASKAPVLAYAFVSLNIAQGAGIDPRQPDFVRRSRDPGRGMVLLLDARERLGQELVVWLIDMPSDLSLSRDESSRQARAAMLATPPRLWKMRDDHRTRERVSSTPELLERLKRPDVIAGDFNAPRGSASLRHVTMGARNAFDQAGEGYCATFPRERSLWHLDQVFVGATMKAVRYAVIDAPSGSHRPQLADVVRATPRPGSGPGGAASPASPDHSGPSAGGPAPRPAGTGP